MGENKGLNHNDLGSNPAQSKVPNTSMGPDPRSTLPDCPDPLSQLSFQVPNQERLNQESKNKLTFYQFIYVEEQKIEL